MANANEHVVCKVGHGVLLIKRSVFLVIVSLWFIYYLRAACEPVVFGQVAPDFYHTRLLSFPNFQKEIAS